MTPVEAKHLVRALNAGRVLRLVRPDKSVRFVRQTGGGNIGKLHVSPTRTDLRDAPPQERPSGEALATWLEGFKAPPNCRSPGCDYPASDASLCGECGRDLPVCDKHTIDLCPDCGPDPDIPARPAPETTPPPPPRPAPFKGPRCAVEGCGAAGTEPSTCGECGREVPTCLTHEVDTCQRCAARARQ